MKFITIFGSCILLLYDSLQENTSYLNVQYSYNETNTNTYNNDVLLTDFEYDLETTNSTPTYGTTDLFANISKMYCPPGFYKVSPQNEYCFLINEPSEWNYPCFMSTGATVLTDLSYSDFRSMLYVLENINLSRFFWLPAQRSKHYNPLVWTIPGPNWGRRVQTKSFIQIEDSLFKNCLLLDIETRIIKTERCNIEYPSLCFFSNDLQYLTSCPESYHAFKFMPNIDTCFGIEETENNLSVQEFSNNICKNPWNDNDYGNLATYLFRKIAKMNGLPDNKICWFGTSTIINQGNVFHRAINTKGNVGFVNQSVTLSCMTCEMRNSYKETELNLEYDRLSNKLYLTVYYSSGLLKDNSNDNGIRCFSNADGFMQVVEIHEILSTAELEKHNLTYMEKDMFVVQQLTNRSGQYWCEGHTKNLSLISTGEIIIQPQGNEHVFSLVFKHFLNNSAENQNTLNITSVTTDIKKILNVEKVLLMDILEYTQDYVVLLMHLHVKIESVYETEFLNINKTFNDLKSKAEVLQMYNYEVVNISSALCCLPTTTYNSFTLDWNVTPINHVAAPKQLCLQINGLPVNRRCQGSFLLGSQWGDISGDCDGNYEASPRTKFLYEFVQGLVPENVTTQFLVHGLNFVLNEEDVFIPADIYYLSLSLQNVISMVYDDHFDINIGDIHNIAWAMDRVMKIDRSHLRLSQILNSTNVIVDTVNGIIDVLAQNNDITLNHRKRRNYQLSIKSEFLVQISYPGYNNISGIALVKNNSSQNFNDMNIFPLYKNMTWQDIFLIENLEVATWIPENVLNSLKKNSNVTDSDKLHIDHLYIMITVFYNDAVFQELNCTNHKTNSRIIGISIPGYISNLEHPVPLIFNNIQNDHPYDEFCGFWDFDTQMNYDSPGQWAKQGCHVVQFYNNLTMCECYHLTHFGLLLQTDSFSNRSNWPQNYEYHKTVLNKITLIGSFMSLSGVLGIWITACVFTSWRHKPSTKILLHLSTSIAFPLVFLVIFSLDNTMFIMNGDNLEISDKKRVLCIVLGALLHYTTLSSFMWMLITAFLQFVRYVQVLGVCRPSRFMVKSTLVGWLIPMTPVILVCSINPYNYLPESSSKGVSHAICYPSGIYFYMSVLLPIVIILTINITFFILVILAISRAPSSKMKTDIDLIGSQLRLSIFLFFLLGLTWIFGILSFSYNLIWSYLFCLTSTLQDFVLFVYFVVLDPSTRKLWVNLMVHSVYRSKSRESVISISSE